MLHRLLLKLKHIWQRPDALALLECAYLDAGLDPSLGGRYEMIVSPKIALGLRAETGATDHLKFGGITVRIDALERGIRVEPPILRDFPRTVADYAP